MTTPQPSVDSCLDVARELELEYFAESPMLTFGEWSLQRVFPDVMLDPYRARDFAGAQRTSDARCYLIGMLMSNTLPLEAARNFLNECAAAQD